MHLTFAGLFIDSRSFRSFEVFSRSSLYFDGSLFKANGGWFVKKFSWCQHHERNLCIHLGKLFGIVFQLLRQLNSLSIFPVCLLGGGFIGMTLPCFDLPSQRSKTGAVAYIWLFQSVPLLTLLFLFGLGIPRLFGQNVDPRSQQST